MADLITGAAKIKVIEVGGGPCNDENQTVYTAI